MGKWKAIAVAGALVAVGTAAAGAVEAAPNGPCGTDGSAPPAQWDHVVLVMMENKSYKQVFTTYASEAPYLKSLAAQCGVATNYWSLWPRSVPNYLALSSGSNHGVTDDLGPKKAPISGPSLFSQLGSDWLALNESMGTNCQMSSAGLYPTHHNPALYYTSIRSQCATQDIPLDSKPDLSKRFTIITPNLLHDMHRTDATPTNAERVAAGDAWLSDFVPELVATPEYQAGRTAIFITWDEGRSVDLRVPLIVISPHTGEGVRDDTRYTHYSLVRAMQEMMGLSPLLDNAASATSVRGARLGV
jgi:hypothetical protein